jgi:type II secretory pathway component PulK
MVAMSAELYVLVIGLAVSVVLFVGLLISVFVHFRRAARRQKEAQGL